MSSDLSMQAFTCAYTLTRAYTHLHTENLKAQVQWELKAHDSLDSQEQAATVASPAVSRVSSDAVRFCSGRVSLTDLLTTHPPEETMSPSPP